MAGHIDGSLREVLRDTIHSFPQGIKRLADLFGKNESYFYRSYSSEDNGRAFDVNLLPTLIHITQDFRILHHLAHMFDFVLVEWPSSKPSESDLTKATNSIQRKSANLVNALLLYRDKPDSTNHRKLQRNITETMSSLAGLRLRLKHSNQEVLPL